MTYVIVNFSDVTQDMLDDCVGATFDNIRHSQTEPDRVILKYNGGDPAWVTTLSLTKYSSEEILSITSEPDWTSEEDWESE